MAPCSSASLPFAWSTTLICVPHIELTVSTAARRRPCASVLRSLLFAYSLMVSYAAVSCADCAAAEVLVSLSVLASCAWLSSILSMSALALPVEPVRTSKAPASSLTSFLAPAAAASSSVVDAFRLSACFLASSMLWTKAVMPAITSAGPTAASASLATSAAFDSVMRPAACALVAASVVLAAAASCLYPFTSSLERFMALRFSSTSFLRLSTSSAFALLPFFCSFDSLLTAESYLDVFLLAFCTASTYLSTPPAALAAGFFSRALFSFSFSLYAFSAAAFVVVSASA